MKKVFVLFVLLLCGCSNRASLNCSYVDNSSILGIKRVNDIITFRNDKIVSYERNIGFSLNSEINDSTSVYKIIKLEGKALKKYIGGKYKISKNNNEINLIFSSKKVDRLNYIGIDSDYGYDGVINVYSGLGFECK